MKTISIMMALCFLTACHKSKRIDLPLALYNCETVIHTPSGQNQAVHVMFYFDGETATVLNENKTSATFSQKICDVQNKETITFSPASCTGNFVSHFYQSSWQLSIHRPDAVLSFSCRPDGWQFKKSHN
jgi:hypothetical protein